MMVAMRYSARSAALAAAHAPSAADIESLAHATFTNLPPTFRRLCEGLVIQVVDFPDDETLDEMGAESEFDLLGLFVAQQFTAAEHGIEKVSSHSINGQYEESGTRWRVRRLTGRAFAQRATVSGNNDLK